jgi:hypothetical protein
MRCKSRLQVFEMHLESVISSLEYQGPEGNLTFYGKDMAVQSSPLGTLLTITLKFNNDTGGITPTLLKPHTLTNKQNTLAGWITQARVSC